MRPAALVAVALALLVGGCGGGDDPKPSSSSPPTQSPSPSVGQLPPGFLKCMRDRGYEITSPDQIHSAPPQVLQACFGAAHQTP
jgi:hypothetical protein